MRSVVRPVCSDERFSDPERRRVRWVGRRTVHIQGNSAKSEGPNYCIHKCYIFQNNIFKYNSYY
jgi:hypothetical protein